MFAVMAKIYGVLYKQSSSIAFDEISSYLAENMALDGWMYDLYFSHIKTMRD